MPTHNFNKSDESQAGPTPTCVVMKHETSATTARRPERKTGDRKTNGEQTLSFPTTIAELIIRAVEKASLEFYIL